MDIEDKNYWSFPFIRFKHGLGVIILVWKFPQNHLSLGHGGVRQYLHRMFPDVVARAEDLAKVLQNAIPKSQDVDYVENYPLPSCFPGPFRISKSSKW